MNSNLKTAMFAVAIMAASYGGYKAYSSHSAYMSENDLLISENVEALSGGGEGGSASGMKRVVVPGSDKACWRKVVSNESCKEHPYTSNGKTYYHACTKTIVRYVFDHTSYSYKDVTTDEFIEQFWKGPAYEMWKNEYACNSPMVRNDNQPKGSFSHSYKK